MHDPHCSAVNGTMHSPVQSDVSSSAGHSQCRTGLRAMSREGWPGVVQTCGGVQCNLSMSRSLPSTRLSASSPLPLHGGGRGMLATDHSSSGYFPLKRMKDEIQRCVVGDHEPPCIHGDKPLSRSKESG